MAAMNDYSSKLHEAMWWMNNTASNSPQGSPYKGVVHHSQPWPSHYQEQDEKDEDMEEQNDEQEEDAIEYMFEKALTPSDVGKLNRLVIPKQHAEKYFPLSRLDSVEKGLLLSFEDESGKLWRFRYSYWNSSQSYVLTKGWSRYVKEKQLDAGDVVSFQRRRPDGQQLYIRWQRRAATLAAAAAGPPPPVHDGRLCHSFLAPTSSTSSSSPGWSRVYYSAHPAYPSHQHHHHSTHGPLYHAAVQPLPQSPVKPGSRKQVRLFGVNLNCDLDEPEPPSPEVSSSSNHDPAHFFSSHGFQQDYNSSQEYHNASYPGGGGDLSI